MIITAQQIVVVENDSKLSKFFEHIFRPRATTLHLSLREALLESRDALEADCFLVEVDLPGMSGVELRKQLSMKGKASRSFS